MPTIVDLTLENGEDTPVIKTFVPVNRVDNTITYEDRSSGVPMAYPVITTSFRQPLSKTLRAYKVSIKLSLPKTIEMGIAPNTSVGLAHTNLANIDFVFHESSTLTDRKDLIALIRNALLETTLESMILDARPLFG